MSKMGMQPLSALELTRVLDIASEWRSSMVLAGRVDWGRIRKLLQSRARASGLLESVVTEVTSSTGSESPQNANIEIMSAPLEKRKSLIHDLLIRRLAIVLGTPQASVEASRPLVEMGLDSLMIVELLPICKCKCQ
jgi:hypothetical protein